MELVLELMVFGRINLLPGIFIIDASICSRTEGLESKEE
jgi:hypothetical protein